MINETDKAWLAGIIDAKAVLKRDRHRALRVNICSAKSGIQDALPYINAITGGDAKWDATSGNVTGYFIKKACREHCPEKHIHVDSTVVKSLCITGLRAAVVMTGILPYLRIQRQEAEWRLKEYSDQFDGYGPGHGVAAKQRLEELGWEIPADLKAIAEGKYMRSPVWQLGKIAHDLHQQGLGWSDIGRSMNCPPSTAKTRALRYRQSTS